MNKYALSLVLYLVFFTFTAYAEEIQIVALGASGTYGQGVSRNEAYPAQIEAMMKAEGYSIRVKNEGINGDTTADMLNRLDSCIPTETQIVILQPAGINDRRAASKMKRGAVTTMVVDTEEMLRRC